MVSEKGTDIVPTDVGLSHGTAPLEVRENMVFGQSQAGEVLCRLRSEFPEAVVLSTCNRIELYVVPQDTSDPASIFGTAFPGMSERYGSYLFTFDGTEAALHTFRIASGLDSVIFREAKVLGQVHRAWDIAHEAKSTGAITSRLFHTALATGKAARTETDVGKLSASVSSAAIGLAKQTFGGEIVIGRFRSYITSPKATGKSLTN